jgi:hypothetical protein
MTEYPATAVERAMKVQEVILRAMAKRLTGWQAAEILGISERSLRRGRQRYQAPGDDGLFDRRRGRPGLKRVPLKPAEEVLPLYRQKYFDLKVRHFHQKLRRGRRCHPRDLVPRQNAIQAEYLGPFRFLVRWSDNFRDDSMILAEK